MRYYKRLLIIEYQVDGLKYESQASLLVKELTSVDNNYFCYIDYKQKKCYTLSLKKEDINLNIRGSKFSLLSSIPYSEKIFYEMYIGNENSSLSESKNELPKFINTGNTFKDDLNYYNIKQIYNKLK